MRNNLDNDVRWKRAERAEGFERFGRQKHVGRVGGIKQLMLGIHDDDGVLVVGKLE